VKPHKVFRREVQHLFVEKEISIAQAALGDTVEVPTLDGEEPLTVPAGTQSGARFTLRGKGMPSLRGNGRGDEYVIVKVVTPRKLTKRQRELLLEFAKLDGQDITPQDKTAFGKVKDAFKAK